MTTAPQGAESPEIPSSGSFTLDTGGYRGYSGPASVLISGGAKGALRAHVLRSNDSTALRCVWSTSLGEVDPVTLEMRRGCRWWPFLVPWGQLDHTDSGETRGREEMLHVKGVCFFEQVVGFEQAYLVGKELKGPGNPI